MSSGSSFRIDLPFVESWQLTEEMRTGILACLATVYPQRDFCELVAMVVSELLENAIKYGDWSRASAAPGIYRLTLEGDGDKLEVAVSHPVIPGPTLDRLFESIRFIAQAPSAEEAYVERLREVAARSDGVGGLGLVRVAHEAGCRLSARLSPDGVLTLSAVTSPLAPPGSSLPVARPDS